MEGGCGRLVSRFKIYWYSDGGSNASHSQHLFMFKLFKMWAKLDTQIQKLWIFRPSYELIEPPISHLDDDASWLELVLAFRSLVQHTPDVWYRLHYKYTLMFSTNKIFEATFLPFLKLTTKMKDENSKNANLCLCLQLMTYPTLYLVC